MPQLKNAKKALRQSHTRAEHNKAIKDNIAYLMKKARKQGEAKDAQADATVKAVIKAIDKAAQKGILKKNTAARRKSRLVKRVRAMAPEAK